MNAEMKIGDAFIMLSEAKPEFEAMPTMIHLYVENADELSDRAIQAGEASIMEPRDEFYGDRSAGVKSAGVKDATGNLWWIATHQENVSSTEIEERIKTLFGSKEELQVIEPSFLSIVCCVTHGRFNIKYKKVRTCGLFLI